MDDITPDPIMQIASGFMAAKFLFAANEFSFFDALKDSPVGLAGLAARTGLTERSARILADGCVAIGLLHKQDGVYSNSAPADRFLTGGGLAPGLRFWDQVSFPAWARFADSLADGPSQLAVELPPETQQIMLDGIEAVLAGPTHAWSRAWILRDRRQLLDLGCGNGSWATAALLVMADFWTDPTHTQPVPAALMAGEFAAHNSDGDVYSVEEVTGWLHETGWQLERHQPLAGPQSAVIAKRV